MLDKRGFLLLETLLLLLMLSISVIVISSVVHSYQIIERDDQFQNEQIEELYTQ